MEGKDFLLVFKVLFIELKYWVFFLGGFFLDVLCGDLVNSV